MTWLYAELLSAARRNGAVTQWRVSHPEAILQQAVLGAHDRCIGLGHAVGGGHQSRRRWGTAKH